MDENWEQYILNHIDAEGETLSALSRDAHVNLLRPRMLAGHLQGRILKMLCRMCRPKTVLEIGTFTGYATLCLAEGTDENAVIHTIEMNDELEDFILKHWNRSELMKKIQLHIGDALDIIPQLNWMFDFVFIDADKRLYSEYYELVFDKVAPGGIIVADNTLWDGKVLKMPPDADAQTAGIATFNDKVAADRRVEKVILPVRDGLSVIYKKT